MKLSRRCSHALVIALPLAAAACGDDAAGTTTSSASGTGGAQAGTGGAGGSDDGDTSSSTTDGAGGAGGSAADTVSSSTSSSSSSSSSTGSGGGAGVDDPNLDGPYATAQLEDSVTAADGSDMPIFAVYPTAGPQPGPYPVVVVAHGFQLPASQYASYVRRLATHGFVALTADYPTGFTGVNNVDNANDLLAALDWAGSTPELVGVADASQAGMTGHSMGGKLALLAASFDDRVRATITLDPVDGAMGCNPTDCPDVSDLMPLAVPTGFLGETTDATGTFQACAPAADNYTTFYAGTTSPSLQVTVNGANHMSFLDDVDGCGFLCDLCNPATADDLTVNALARAYVVAFYRRWLKGEASYDAYLTGAEAQQRYVTNGLATIQSK